MTAPHASPSTSCVHCGHPSSFGQKPIRRPDDSVACRGTLARRQWLRGLFQTASIRRWLQGAEWRSWGKMAIYWREWASRAEEGKTCKVNGVIWEFQWGWVFHPRKRTVRRNIREKIRKLQVWLKTMLQKAKQSFIETNSKTSINKDLPYKNWYRNWNNSYSTSDVVPRIHHNTWPTSKPAMILEWDIAEVGTLKALKPAAFHSVYL